MLLIFWLDMSAQVKKFVWPDLQTTNNVDTLCHETYAMLMPGDLACADGGPYLFPDCFAELMKQVWSKSGNFIRNIYWGQAAAAAGPAQGLDREYNSKFHYTGIVDVDKYVCICIYVYICSCVVYICIYSSDLPPPPLSSIQCNIHFKQIPLSPTWKFLQLIASTDWKWNLLCNSFIHCEAGGVVVCQAGSISLSRIWIKRFIYKCVLY